MDIEQLFSENQLAALIEELSLNPSPVGRHNHLLKFLSPSTSSGGLTSSGNNVLSFNHTSINHSLNVPATFLGQIDNISYSPFGPPITVLSSLPSSQSNNTWSGNLNVTEYSSGSQWLPRVLPIHSNLCIGNGDIAIEPTPTLHHEPLSGPLISCTSGNNNSELFPSTWSSMITTPTLLPSQYTAPVEPGGIFFTPSLSPTADQYHAVFSTPAPPNHSSAFIPLTTTPTLVLNAVHASLESSPDIMRAELDLDNSHETTTPSDNVEVVNLTADYRPLYSCPQCPSKVGSKQSLQRHLWTHDPSRKKNVPCPLGCGRKYVSKHSATRHAKSCERRSVAWG
jgi:hypothetical protein